MALKMKKRKRPVVPALSTEGIESLDANGVVTFPLCTNFNATIAQLRDCTNNWFHTNLALMLREPVVKPSIELKQSTSKQIWDALPSDVRLSYVNRIDMRTDEGMRLVFDSDYITKLDWWKTLPGNFFFRQAIMYVKMGNSAMPLGSMAGWTSAGFGFWAHLIPNIGLAMVIDAMNFMKTLGLAPGLPAHFPHPIYKPPGGSPLGIHHDQMSPRELLQNLRDHVSSSDSSTGAWVRKHGCQLLAHIQGNPIAS